MDGWALGRTKVFLKYYHVEFLSKLYEDQLKKIIMVQACVRRWLAKIRFKKEKWQFAVSVVTLQRHIRGWLSRKRIIDKMKAAKAEEVAATLEQMAEQEKNRLNKMKSETADDEGKESKENFNIDNAAVVIQSRK